jgi:hypothetical protein
MCDCILHPDPIISILTRIENLEKDNLELKEEIRKLKNRMPLPRMEDCTVE